jgi:hypothetical protein
MKLAIHWRTRGFYIGDIEDLAIGAAREPYAYGAAGHPIAASGRAISCVCRSWFQGRLQAIINSEDGEDGSQFGYI